MTNQKRKQCSSLEQERKKTQPPQLTNEEADIMIGEQEFYSYTKKFKYLGSIFTSSLKDDEDIKRRISQACGAFAQAKNVLCNRKLQAITRIRFYEETVVNLLLWEGERCWALTKEQQRKLEVCHHRSLTKTAGITNNII